MALHKYFTTTFRLLPLFYFSSMLNVRKLNGTICLFFNIFILTVPLFMLNTIPIGIAEKDHVRSDLSQRSRSVTKKWTQIKIKDHGPRNDLRSGHFKSDLRSKITASCLCYHISQKVRAMHVIFTTFSVLQCYVVNLLSLINFKTWHQCKSHYYQT